MSVWFHRQVRRGFSIVELLVVTGIITVLVALLLPSLNRAREQANRTRCMSNLRQIGLALTIYKNDFRDYPLADAMVGKPTKKDVTSPLFVASRRSGLLAMRSSPSFNRYW